MLLISHPLIRIAKEHWMSFEPFEVSSPVAGVIHKGFLEI